MSIEDKFRLVVQFYSSGEFVSFGSNNKSTVLRNLFVNQALCGHFLLAFIGKQILLLNSTVCSVSLITTSKAHRLGRINIARFPCKLLTTFHLSPIWVFWNPLLLDIPWYKVGANFEEIIITIRCDDISFTNYLLVSYDKYVTVRFVFLDT